MLQFPVTEKIRSLLLKTAISTGVLCVIFYYVPVSDVFSLILTAAAPWLFTGISMQIVMRVLTALRMDIIAGAQGINVGIATMLRIVFSSSFYNIVAPGALAGGAMTYMKYRQHGVKSVAAVTNIYVNKAIEFLVISLSAPLFWLLDSDYSITVILSYTICMVVIFIILFALFLGRYGSFRWLESFIRGHGQSVLHKALMALFHQLDQAGSMSRSVIASLVVYTLLYYLMSASAITCFGKAIDIEVDFLVILWVYPVIYLLAMLPISVSNVGVREAVMIMLLAPYGISTAEAMAWSMLMYCGPLSSASIGFMLEFEQHWLRGNSNRGQAAGTDMEPVDADGPGKQGGGG